MPFNLRPALLAAPLFASLALAPVALAHFNDKEPNQSYRQSLFTLLAMNFGPIASMVKGEIPWDAEKLEGYADDLEDVAELDLLRGFAPGSEKGTTRAKPAIWENTEDFAAKLEDLRAATEVLEEAAEDGDREAIAAAVGTVGKACKACHDEYKAKDYLY